MKKNMKWDERCTESLDILMDVMKQSIINDAEDFAIHEEVDFVSPQALEIALYKSISTLNATNHATIIKKIGIELGTKLIASLETRAQSHISNILLEEIKEKNGGELPEEVQKIQELLNEFKKRPPEEDVDL